MRILFRFAALLALTQLATADVFIVDASGGAGSDFTDLPAAVSAAAVASGDTLLVRAGLYSAFTVDKGLSICRNSGAVQVSGTIVIQNLTDGPWFSMTGVDADGLRVASCSAPVFVASASFKTARVTNCSDVRLRKLEVRANTASSSGQGEDALRIEVNSRVELVHCVVVGGQGGVGDSGFDDGGNGGTGMIVGTGSVVHLALSDVGGGDGGELYYGEWGGEPGDGGDGVYVTVGGQLIVSGRPSDWIWEGAGGIDFWTWGASGSPGIGLYNRGMARESGVSISTINTFWGTLEQPTDPDPVLLTSRLLGGGVRAEVIGVSGGNVRLYLGTEPLISGGGILVKPSMGITRQAVAVGAIDPSGSIQVDLNNAFAVPSGERIVLIIQASVVQGGLMIRSNSKTGSH